MTALLSTREALMKSLCGPLCHHDSVDGYQHCATQADRVLASGAVIDAATLADDEALRARYRRAWGSGPRAPKDDKDAALDIGALIRALSEPAPRCGECGPGYRLGDDGCRHGESS